MIRKFNADITAYLAAQDLGDCAFWQVRGIVLEVEEVEHPTRDKNEKQLRDFWLKIGDIDHGSDGFDVRLEGVFHQIEPLDIVSLIGHERKDAEAISHPRLLINHNTGGHFARVYPIGKRLPYGAMPLIEYKFWLARKVPMKTATGRVFLFGFNFWKVLAWLLGFWILTKIGGEKSVVFALVGGFISMGFFLLVALSVLPTVAAIKAMERIVAQAPFSFEKRKVPSLLMKNWGDYTSNIFFDLTPIYENLARLFDQDALKNPAPEIGFVPVERGFHTVGLLDKPTPPKIQPEKPRQPAAPVKPKMQAQPIAPKPKIKTPVQPAAPWTPQMRVQPAAPKPKPKIEKPVEPAEAEYSPHQNIFDKVAAVTGQATQKPE